MPDARLAALAPELLKALQDMTSCGCEECMRIAIATINKAMGLS